MFFFSVLKVFFCVLFYRNFLFFWYSICKGFVLVVKLGINFELNFIRFRKFFILDVDDGWVVFYIVCIFFLVGLMLCFERRMFMKIILFILKVYFLLFMVRFFFFSLVNNLCKFWLCFIIVFLWIMKLLVMFIIFLMFVIIWLMICWYFLGVVLILKFSFL